MGTHLASRPGRCSAGDVPGAGQPCRTASGTEPCRCPQASCELEQRWTPGLVTRMQQHPGLRHPDTAGEPSLWLPWPTRSRTRRVSFQVAQHPPRRGLCSGLRHSQAENWGAPRAEGATGCLLQKGHKHVKGWHSDPPSPKAGKGGPKGGPFLVWKEDQVGSSGVGWGKAVGGSGRPWGAAVGDAGVSPVQLWVVLGVVPWVQLWVMLGALRGATVGSVRGSLGAAVGGPGGSLGCNSGWCWGCPRVQLWVVLGGSPLGAIVGGAWGVPSAPAYSAWVGVPWVQLGWSWGGPLGCSCG